MNSAAMLYPDRLLAHARAPKRRQPLARPCESGQASNRLCGDEVRVSLRLDGGRIEDFGFEAEACAITVAAASMLGDAAIAQRIDDVAALGEAFRDWLGGADADESPPDSVRIAGIDAFAELRKLPSRRRCALLPFEALSAAIGAIETSRKDRDD